MEAKIRRLIMEENMKAIGELKKEMGCKHIWRKLEGEHEYECRECDYYVSPHSKLNKLIKQLLATKKK